MKLGPLNAPIPPTSPPKRLLPPPVTFPWAWVSEKLPSPVPLKPPAKLDAPTLTSPVADDERIFAVLLWPVPTVQLGQLLSLLALLLPTRPPAVLLSPAATAPFAAELPIKPWFCPTKPPP